MANASSHPPGTDIASANQEKPALFSDAWIVIALDAKLRSRQLHDLRTLNIYYWFQFIGFGSLALLTSLAWFTSPADELTAPWQDINILVLFFITMDSGCEIYRNWLERRLLRTIEQISSRSPDDSATGLVPNQGTASPYPSELKSLFPVEWYHQSQNTDLRRVRLWELQRKEFWNWRLGQIVGWLRKACLITAALLLLAAWTISGERRDDLFAWCAWLVIIMFMVAFVPTARYWRFATERTLLQIIDRFNPEVA